MNKPNYEFKAKVIASGLPKLRCEWNISEYRFHNCLINGEKPDPRLLASVSNCRLLDEIYREECPEEWAEAEKINHASFCRAVRLKKRITEIFESGPCVFLTLTFTDFVLSRTSPETRRAYVKRFLTALGAVYVANKDFGEKKGREHYHALVATDKVNPKLWKYGAINIKRVNTTDLDKTRIAKYISKLTNHAIKATTKRSVLMYSRKA